MPKLGYKQTEEHKKKATLNRKIRKGSENNFWKGGKSNNGEGYILVMTKWHPNADKRGYVLEHRLVMEEYLGRYLTKNEVIHHINGILADNRIENLMLFSNHSLHLRHEWKNGVYFSGRNEEWKNKLSKAHMGKIPWNKGKKGLQVPWNKGLAKLNGGHYGQTV